MNDDVELILISDERFVTQISVVLASAVAHATRPVRATVLATGYTAEHERRLRSVSGLAGLDVVHAPDDLVRQFPISFKFQPITYLRLFLDQLIERPIGRCLYLDGDMLVRHDVAELIDTDLGDNVLGAVQDWWISWFSRPNGIVEWRNLGLAPTAPYFNAGLLLFDLEHWRATGFCDAMRQYLRDHTESLRHNDQDPLNVCAHGRWRELGPRWNYQLHAQPRRPLAFHNADPSGSGFAEMLYAPEALDAAIADPAVVHFTGSAKPWGYEAHGTVPYASEWVTTALSIDPSWAAVPPPVVPVRTRIAERIRAVTTVIRRGYS